ncbi:MAG TPA: CatB-related O-acetyltransferase [Planctomycetes bacterium]|nr:CatB-related O-acetyltransferase [Planctomycetota bacterium]
MEDLKEELASVSLEGDPRLKRSPLSPLILGMGGRSRWVGLARKIAYKLEGGYFYSYSLRKILQKRRGVTIGAYSYGGCFVERFIDPGTVIGHFVSVAEGVRIMGRNHPLNAPSLHPFFFNAQLGWVAKDLLPYRPIFIGHDAWIGANALIMPSVERVGIGSVIGAGSIVTKDVPDFAVVVGSPAKIVKYRFSEEERDLLLASRWWELSIQKAIPFLQDFGESRGRGAEFFPKVSSRAFPEGAE